MLLPFAFGRGHVTMCAFLIPERTAWLGSSQTGAVTISLAWNSNSNSNLETLLPIEKLPFIKGLRREA
jgi:hypothetical protein